MIAFKGNYIWSAGKIFMTHRVYLLITSSWPRHRVYHRGDHEVRDEDEVNEAIETGADVVMLDGIEGSELASVVLRLRERWAG